MRQGSHEQENDRIIVELKEMGVEGGAEKGGGDELGDCWSNSSKSK